MFQKVLLTAFVILLLVFGIKYLKRLLQAEAGRAAVRPPAGRAGAVQDMTACPVCGDYVVADMDKPCGRPGCPFGR